MEPRKSYVYSRQSAHPAKRRRLAIDDDLSSSRDLRKAEFENQWSIVERQAREVCTDINQSLLEDLARFVLPEDSSLDPGGKIKVAVVSSSDGSTSCDLLFEQLATENVLERTGFASLEAAECTNLKTLLKALIQKASRTSDTDQEDALGSNVEPRAAKLLNYDLRQLHKWCLSRDIFHIVVALPEGDAIDVDSLAALLSQLHSWSNRIKFSVLLGIRAPSEIFSSRLPKSIQKLIQPQSYATASAEDVVNAVFHNFITDSNLKVFPGPSLVDTLLMRQREHMIGIEALLQSLKYAYMSHFFGNPLSALVSTEIVDLHSAHFEVFRSTPQFQEHAESLLKGTKAALVKKLLDSDEMLATYIQEQARISREKLLWVFRSIETVTKTQAMLGQRESRFTTLYVQALDGDLIQSSNFRELMLRLRSCSTDTIIHILEQIQNTLMALPPCGVEVSPDTFGDLVEQLSVLEGAEQEDSTLITKKTRNSSASRQKKPSKEEEQRSKVLRICAEAVAEYFKKTLEVHNNLFPTNILFYDFKAPHRDAFTPKVRFAIERALTVPQDYLGCDCCEAVKEGLSSNQPPSAVLYQLYLESGPLVNLFDLWSAFQAVLGDKFQDEQVVKALFLKSLAELKVLGFFKATRKRVDHVAKLAWRGL